MDEKEAPMIISLIIWIITRTQEEAIRKKQLKIVM